MGPEITEKESYYFLCCLVLEWLQEKTKQNEKKTSLNLGFFISFVVPLHYWEIIYNKLYPVKWITFIASIKIKMQNISSTNNGFSYPLQSMPLLPCTTGNHWLTSDIMDWFIVYISGKFVPGFFYSAQTFLNLFPFCLCQ